VRRRIEYFASKACVDINGLGPATIDALVDHGLVKSVADLYRLKRIDLLTLSGVGEKTADNLLTEIDRSRSAELWRVINGLSIFHVGAITAKGLAARFGSLTALTQCSRAELSAASGGFGSTTAESVLAFFARPENRAIVAALVDARVGSVSGAKSQVSRSGLAGKVFVLTGTLPNLTRAEASKRIVAAGGRVTDSVSRKTDFVVVGKESGEKLTAARNLGITTINEAELIRMLGEE
jgi:DNA ligase (NAD+)